MNLNILLLRTFILISIFALAASARLSAQSGSVLLVASNTPSVNGKTNGTYLVEIAATFNYFTGQGYKVDVVSPQGGKAAIYHKGDTSAALKKMALDPQFMKQTANTLKPGVVRSADYSAVVFPGGYGLFTDVYRNDEISRIAASIYEAGGVIGSLGHGTACLLNIQLGNGDNFVKGKTLVCFPSWFEKEYMSEADHGKLLPLDMQQELLARGADLKINSKEKSNENLTWLDAEHRLVTASFADDGEFVAKGVCTLLEKKKK